jgi:hypothetical protein
MKIQVKTITINVLSHKFPVQAKTRPPLEGWFKSELPLHLLYPEEDGVKTLFQVQIYLY